MRYYACIDLKSFYASCECVERNLNPLTTNLVVADINRTEKTICLAVTPSLKKLGLSGRSRLYEVVEKVKEANEIRKLKINNHKFSGKSYDENELIHDKTLELEYIVASPRMALYMKYSTNIYNIYLKYLSSDDVFSYSIDEVFCDITDYLNYYKKTPVELVTMIIKDIYLTTGITATGGIGTNMYLAKIAMDIVAKHTTPNEFGVRIAYLDELRYRKTLWAHEPLTDFWRVGSGISNKLKQAGMFTMGDIARCSINNEDLLYNLFGVNAELLIDHAWGYEPCTIKDIKSYKPTTTSISQGQVLHTPYDHKKAKIIIREMAELISLDLVEKNYVTDTLVLTIGYDIENLQNKKIKNMYSGDIVKDHYGRSVPKPAHGTIRINHKTSSIKLITEYLLNLYDRIVNPFLLIRRINIAACDLTKKNEVKKKVQYEQFDLFSNQEEKDIQNKKILEDEKKEENAMKTIIEIKKKYGKNAILKGIDLVDGATIIDRNNQIGGHKSA